LFKTQCHRTEIRSSAAKGQGNKAGITTGHKFGIGSPEQFAALASCDKALEKIRAAVEGAGMGASSVFILTSDHGGHNAVDPEKKTVGTHGSAEADDVLIPWIAWGKGVKKGFGITLPVVTYDTAATALWLLGVPVPEGFWGRPVTQCL
jgi:arylsulfatase A-like enzyme